MACVDIRDKFAPRNRVFQLALNIQRIAQVKRDAGLTLPQNDPALDRRSVGMGPLLKVALTLSSQMDLPLFAGEQFLAMFPKPLIDRKML